MSYSICINCEEMVPAYEKYCARCLKRYPQLKQVVDFWRNWPYTETSWNDAKALAKKEISGGTGEGTKR